jgi:hypothetical protein
MACREETTVLNGAEYYCRQWPAEKAILTKFKMAKMFGPAIASLIPALESEDLGCISDAVQKLFEAAEPQKLLDFMQDVVFTSTRDGQRLDKKGFNDIYSDNLMEFYQAFFFVLKVNYASFFGGKLGQTFLKKMEAKLSAGSKDTAQT